MVPVWVDHMEMVSVPETGELEELSELSSGQLLDCADALAATQRACELELLRVAVHFAYAHAADRLDPENSRLPGRERARRPGGVGTPEVGEFAAGELGARIGCSTVTAWMLMADGLDICHRLPRLWARVRAGEVRVHLARLVARRTRDLSVEQADHVDERVAEYADGRVTYSRFEKIVDAAVVAADIEAAREREAKESQAQWAGSVRPDPAEEQVAPGLRRFSIRAPFGVVKVFDAAVTRIADILGALGDEDPVDQRRVKALLVLARPAVATQLFADYTAWTDRPEDPQEVTEAPRTGAKPVIEWDRLLPTTVVNVHVYAGADVVPIARVEGCGVMTQTWVTEHLTRAARVTVRPVLDLEGQAPVDAYEIPDRHRRAVRLMTPADTFPWGTSLNPDQIDHTEPYRHGSDAVGAGQSRLGNYGPMSTPHHRLKTFGRWMVKQPFPGIYLWRDPHGHHYLVDHTGTRALSGAA